MKTVLSLSLLILTIILVFLSFTTCGGTYKGFQRCYSYEECTECIEEFKENGFTRFPILVFDLDSEEKIYDLSYMASFLLNYRDFKFFRTHERVYGAGLSFYVEFYLDDADTSENGAEHAIKVNVCCMWHEICDEDIEDIELKFEEYYVNYAWSDKSDSPYNYISIYYLQINGIDACQIEISSVQELTSENICEISRIIKDNVVIYS